MATLGQRLKELRKKRAIPQKEIASILGFKSTRAIRYIEADKRRVDHHTLIVLADYFNVSIDYLVGRKDDPNE